MPNIVGGNQITDPSQLGDSVVTAAKILDATIANADIAAAARIATTKIAKGVAGSVLRSEGVDEDPAFSTKQIDYKLGTETRVGNAAGGVQNIAHGLGRTPLRVHIRAFKSNGSSFEASCDGHYNGVNTAVVYRVNIGTDFAGGMNTTYVIIIGDDATSASEQIATITVDATNIILTWTKSGTPSVDNINILWEVW